MKIRIHIPFIFIVLITFYPNSSTLADSNKKVVSENDAEYIIKSIDVDSGKFNPSTPHNEAQSILTTAMQDFIQLNVESNKKIARIGPIEFSTFTELKNKANVAYLKENLMKYWDIKRAHYNAMDTLLKKYRIKLNYGSEQDKRLSGTAQQFIEQMEERYVFDLNKFYEFILKYHEKINFSENQIYIDDQNLVNKFNVLWEEAIKSATELTTAKKTGKDIMGNSIKDWQKEISIK